MLKTLPNIFKKKNKEVKLWHVILLSPIMAGLFFWGAYMLSQSITLHQDGVRTEAEVTNVQIEEDDDGTKYYPTFKFTDEAGEVHIKTTNFSTSTPYEVGEIIEVIYLTESPYDSAKINRFEELWLLPIILIFAATVTELVLVFKLTQQRSQRESGIQIEEPDEPSLAAALLGDRVKSRYWQTVPMGDKKQLQVQYQYQGETYTILSRDFSDKKLRKLTPGQEITLLVRPETPDEAMVLL